MADVAGLNPIAAQRMLRATAMTCNAFRASDHGNARPHTTGESVRCLNCDDPQWKHWLRQAVLSAQHLTTCAVGLIEAERQRQVDHEGWTVEHDDAHVNGELRDAAIAYAMACDNRAGECAVNIWPFEPSWWKPSDDPVRNLVKAGALIAAEIERRRRQSAEQALWEVSQAPDAVARAEGTSSDGPRASNLHPLSLPDRLRSWMTCGNEALAGDLEEAAAQLARVTADREEARGWLVEQLQSAGRDVAELPIWAGGTGEWKARAEAAEAALSAHREATLKLANQWRTEADDNDNTAPPMMLDPTTNRAKRACADQLAALASPRQVEQEHDKNDDHTRVAESSPPDWAALPHRPAS